VSIFFAELLTLASIHCVFIFTFQMLGCVLCRSGGNWSTTYAPSPFYMTSKMRSLYLEGYDYSMFDLTKPDRVQIQVAIIHTELREPS
jgi:hypothetical protein